MSSPNRTKVFVGFGVVAIVLVAAIAMWPPNFRSEEASGAIGAVQKHHAPQIAQKDVILGNEKSRNQQSVLYRDFFNDATKFQALSALLASNNEAASVTKEATELANELQSQYANQMESGLAAIELSAKTANDINLAQQAEAMASQVKAAQVLSSAQMQEFNARFAKIAEAASKIILQHATQSNEMGSKSAIILQSADHNLASALLLQGEQAASALKGVQQALNSVEYASLDLASQQAYFSQIEAASHVVGNLAAANIDMANRMSSAQEVANAANKLAHAALLNVEAQTASSVSMASGLAHMQSELAASQLGSSPCCAGAVQDLNNQLAGSKQQFSSFAASSFQAELAAMSEFAASKAQYAKYGIGPQLQASMLAHADMANKLYSNLANDSEIANAAAKLGNALHNEALAAALSNEAQLVNEANELASIKQ